MKRIITAALCLLLTVSVLTGCGGASESADTTEPAASAVTVPPTEATQPAEPSEQADIIVPTEPEETEAPGDPYAAVLAGSYTQIRQVPKQDLSKVDADYQHKAPEKGEVVAIIHTNYGDIKMRFFPEAAPLAVNNFIALAKEDRYDNTIIHRIFHPATSGISGIQGGDYTNFNGSGGISIYGVDFGYEISEYLSNTRGSVAMAHSRVPDSNGSQFYINQDDNSKLDGKYTVFGQVYEGLDVLDAIYAVQTDSSETPLTQINVTSIEITTY